MNYALLDDQKSFHDYFKEQSKKYISMLDCSFYFDSKSLFDDLKNRENWHLDILFLDIDLKYESGFDIAKKLYNYDPTIIVVYLTSKNNLIHNAFGLNVLRFIYKPFFDEDVEGVFNLIINEIDLYKPILIKSHRDYVSLSKKDIVYISKELRKIFIYTPNGMRYETNICNLNEAKNLVDSDNFMMINRSEIVNIIYISEIGDRRLKINTLNKELLISGDRLIDVRDKWRKRYV